MSKLVLSNAKVLINSVDLSNRCKSVTVTQGADAVEQTAMGDAGHNYLAGLLTTALSFEFFGDAGANEVDATLAAILAGGVAVPVEVRATSAARSATNPAYVGNAILESYDGPSGTVGQAWTVKATFKPGDGTGIQRLTS